ncbi:uncharacterized protein LOC143859638 [Tasmannia lanceolata]|uniref:uncharacterized protein LOC143859638 n=1 Tax=Tasmannia lanceolata TaxID=3420 RepID=UPI0040642989
MTLEDLIQTLQVEEESRLRDKKDDVANLSSKVHMVEVANIIDPPTQPWKGKQKRKMHQNGKGSDKNKKRKGACFQCGKMGHYKKECRYRKSNTQGNKDGNKEKFVAMISEVNFVEGEDAWWIDSGATNHVCKDRSVFSTYVTVEDGNVIYMGNSSTAEVKGKGKVELEFTSGKVLTLTDVYHALEVRRNLAFGSLLNKNGFKLVFESNKFVLSKGGIFEGKGYMYERMFKMNINKVNVSVYMIDTISLWHDRLGRVNFRKIQDMTYPKTYEEAIKSQDAAFWKEAINDEMDSIMGCKWIFKKKMKVDGTIGNFKAMLVAKGFTQKAEINYFDTYALVARISTIRFLIALASIYKFDIHQMDVKTTFLNGEFDEEVYMDQPEGFIMPDKEHKVYDMLIFGTDMDSITNTKGFLSFNFEMKDMDVADLQYANVIGSLRYTITCTRPGIALSVGKLSRFTSNPGYIHWNAINRILKYLKGIVDYGLNYSGYPMVLERYTDASWLTEHDDHSSTSG